MENKVKNAVLGILAENNCDLSKLAVGIGANATIDGIVYELELVIDALKDDS